MAFSRYSIGVGTLADLVRPRDGRIVHFSSKDASGGNGDLRRVGPGESLTLLDYAGGSGAIRRWWVTIAPRNNVEIQRQCIVRCYWDGETEPSVEVPITDFFGMGFGEWREFQSLPLNMTSGGYNCYWPMPFRHSARITIENRASVPIDAFYYNIDLLTQSGARIPRFTTALQSRTTPRVGSARTAGISRTRFPFSSPSPSGSSTVARTMPRRPTTARSPSGTRPTRRHHSRLFRAGSRSRGTTATPNSS